MAVSNALKRCYQLVIQRNSIYFLKFHVKQAYLLNRCCNKCTHIRLFRLEDFLYKNALHCLLLIFEKKRHCHQKFLHLLHFRMVVLIHEVNLFQRLTCKQTKESNNTMSYKGLPNLLLSRDSSQLLESIEGRHY